MSARTSGSVGTPARNIFIFACAMFPPHCLLRLPCLTQPHHARQNRGLPSPTLPHPHSTPTPPFRSAASTSLISAHTIPTYVSIFRPHFGQRRRPLTVACSRFTLHAKQITLSGIECHTPEAVSSDAVSHSSMYPVRSYASHSIMTESASSRCLPPTSVRPGGRFGLRIQALRFARGTMIPFGGVEDRTPSGGRISMARAT